MKTAVEYIVEQLFPKALSQEQYYHIEQAKKMEQEQQIEFACQVYDLNYGKDKSFRRAAEEYYN
jgi:hypothetical protein